MIFLLKILLVRFDRPARRPHSLGRQDRSQGWLICNEARQRRGTRKKIKADGVSPRSSIGRDARFRRLSVLLERRENLWFGVGRPVVRKDKHAARLLSSRAGRKHALVFLNFSKSDGTNNVYK
jgi:hypothetical protein